VAIASDIDYAELRRQRRELRKRQIRRRRLTAVAVLVVLAAAALFGLARSLSGSSAAASIVLEPVRSAMPASPFRAPLPEEIRGVHVTAPLMSLPGRFARRLGSPPYWHHPSPSAPQV